MTGADLRKTRKALGLSQNALAQRSGVGRHAVSHWECKTTIDPRGWALRRMLRALGRPDLPDFPTGATRAYRVLASQYARARGGVFVQSGFQASDIRCGAFRNDGKPCRHKVEPDKKRCKFHGGCSTGPKTADGKDRIAEAQRRRWARYCAERGARP